MDSTPGPARRRWWDDEPRWPGRAELRADRRSAVLAAGLLALTGAPAGLLWWALAPRAEFTVTEDGPVVVGRPPAELLAADDGVYVLVLAGLGLLAGAVLWALRRRRGVALLLALAGGTFVAGLLAWQLGELLGAGPAEEEIATVGARLTTGLELGSVPAALAVAPFTAVLVYVVATVLAAAEDLGRPTPATAPAAAPPDRPATDAVQRPLVDVPPSPPGPPA